MKEDLRKKLAAIPEESPDGEDLRMMAEAARINDGSTLSWEAFQDSLSGYGAGRFSCESPKAFTSAWPRRPGWRA